MAWAASILAVDNTVHQQFLAYLAQNRDKFWVDSFANISQHLQKEPLQQRLLSTALSPKS